MGNEVWIEKLTFSGGKTFDLTDSEIVLFVGPNNVGKSASLREIVAKATDPKNVGIVIRDVKVHIDGTVQDLLDWFAAHSIRRESGPGGPTYNWHGMSETGTSIDLLWSAASDRGRCFGLARFVQIFFRSLNTEARLTESNPPQNLSIDQPRQHPIQIMYDDDALEGRFSKIFNQAFGHELIVHRRAGNQIPLYVGKRPDLRLGEDRTSTTYIQRLEASASPLHSQGDGMRSFVGVLLASVEGPHVLLIDEPEAFLHPPQARLLGQILGQQGTARHQVFIATHSGDFLRGALDRGQRNLRVIRITRSDNSNSAHELQQDGIRQLWNDPLLRQSNVLDGVFHEKTVLCEADGDCRVLSAIMNAIWKDRPDDVMPDVMWTHCGGKHRIPTVVKAMRGLNIPTRVVTDFDVLREEQTIKRIVEALGSDWHQFASEWRVVSKAIGDMKPELETGAVRQEITAILDDVKSPTLPQEAVENIQGALRRASSWAIVKRTGKSYVPSGEATVAVERLLEEFRGIGLHIIESGELESFDRSVPSHGPEWVNGFLQKDLTSDPKLRGAREFVERLLA